MSVPAVPELDAMWERIVGDVPLSSRAWLRRTKPIAMHSNTVMLAVSDETTRERIETKLRTEIETKLSAVTGTRTYLAFVIDPSLHVETPDLEIAPPLPLIDEKVRHHRSANPNSDLKLNPRYTFESFVAGSSNRFAHAAAAAVAEQPGKSYNPLMIYGPSGLGKTHLLHAIGHYALSLLPHLKVRYVNSEEFTNEFINAIRLNKTDNSQVEAFHRRYRELDILLIDDIQFIGDKEQTVEGFFHTFNALYENNKQIVLTSDVPPAQLNGFEDRMRSRFASGLLVDVQPPDLETRIAILQKKATTDSLEVTPDVLEYIASRISSNIRELEGALLRVIAFANLSKERIDLPLAEMLLKDFVSDPTDNEVTVPLIMGQCAHYFGITIEQMSSSDRSHTVVEARQIAMYLCRELTDLSLPKIGQAFGRDHTTVMHANKKITALMKEKRETFNHVSELTNRIKQKAKES